MNHRGFASIAFGLACLCAASPLSAQQAAPAQPAPPVPQYGAPVNLEQARRALAGATAEARRQGLPVAIAVVDTAGQLVSFERMDNTQTGSIAAAQDKAMSAAMYRRSTKVFPDALAGGGAGLRVLALRGANPVEGGLPLLVDGRVVGGLGVSGGTADQDGAVAKAGVDSPWPPRGRRQRHEDSTMKRLALSMLACACLALAGLQALPARADAPMVKAQAPGYYRLMLGDFEVTVLSDGTREARALG